MTADDCEFDMRKILLLILVLCLPLQSLAATTLLVLGDSLSAAYGLEQKQGWVSLLERRLHDHCGDCQVINASISGETSAGGRSRIAELLSRHHPDILILELGANDGLRGLPLTEMYSNLDAIISAAQHRAVKVLLLGMRLPPNYGPAYTRDFQNVYQRLSDKHTIAWVPFLLAGLENDRNLFQADGLHPIADAQGVMLENVWPALKALLPGKENSAPIPARPKQPAVHNP
jgi:acyl-CoA thioesterase-1